MSTIRLAVAAALLAVTASTGSAQSPLDARVDSIVKSVMARRLIPGAAVVVVQDGRVVKRSVYGVASIELDVPATPATLFQIASATKNVTGVAVMQLVERGKFGLDDRVTDLLPGLPMTWKPVTVRQLLSHTSGLPDMILDPDKGVWLPGTPDSVIAQLAGKPVAPAGSEWSYNQTNYMLLGMLIERFGGLPYRDYFQQRVFAPLEITGVVFGDTRTVVKGRATEYTRLGIREGASKLTDLKAFSYEYPDALYTAAGIFINADDMGRWLQGVARGATLSKASFEAMTTTVSLNDGKPFHIPDTPMGYGLGWITMDIPEHRSVGGAGGGRAAVMYYPADRLGVAVMTNLQAAGPESLLDLVATEYLKRH
ncbi:MAG: serine hydrolase domain-containing protein [Gemmatimonadota bacterium]